MVNLAQRVFDDSTTWEGAERDLSFHPANPATSRRLTQEQIRFYNEQGYVKGMRVFSDEEIEGHRVYFDRLLDKQMRDGGDSYSLRRLTRFCQPVWDIVTNPLILDYVEDILGSNIVAWGTQYFCKMPGDGKGRLVASGRLLLALHARPHRHPLARSRRCRPRKRLYAGSAQDAHPRNARFRYERRERKQRSSPENQAGGGVWRSRLLRVEGGRDFASRRYARAWLRDKSL